MLGKHMLRPLPSLHQGGDSVGPRNQFLRSSLAKPDGETGKPGLLTFAGWFGCADGLHIQHGRQQYLHDDRGTVCCTSDERAFGSQPATHHSGGGGFDLKGRERRHRRSIHHACRNVDGDSDDTGCRNGADPGNRSVHEHVPGAYQRDRQRRGDCCNHAMGIRARSRRLAPHVGLPGARRAEMNQRFLATIAVVLPTLIARAQSFDSLPEYRPESQVSGTIRALGNHYMDRMLVTWEEGFRKYQPGVQFENRSVSTAHAIPALYFNLADIGLMGREIAPLENLAFRRMFKYDPTELAVATGSYNVPLETFAFAVLVHKDNPLARLSFDQLAAIFGCGPDRNIRTWGQVGLAGGYAHQPIHVYGYATGSNLASFFELKVFKANVSGGPTLPQGARWNCDLKEYSNVYDAHDKVQTDSGDLMMHDLGQDPYGIAYCGIASKTGQVKTLAVSEKQAGPFVEMTRATIMDRSYPLTRSMYIYLNRAPGKPLDLKLKEFFTYLLSREGQQSITGQEVFYPLTAEAAQRDSRKFNNYLRINLWAG